MFPLHAVYRKSTVSHLLVQYGYALYRSAAPDYTGLGARRKPTCLEDKSMRLQHQWWSGLVAAVLGGLVGVTGAAAGEQFLPILGVREGATRSVGIPLANGFIDYLTLLNVRDGGINGVPLVWEECETVGDVTRGIECYE